MTITDRAKDIFGNDAAQWLNTPHPLLDGKTPLEADEQKVQDILNAVKYGGVV